MLNIKYLFINLDGQTGSGKTFTMEGYGSDIGVSPRAIDELFRIIDGSVEDWSYSVCFLSCFVLKLKIYIFIFIFINFVGYF